MSEAKGCMETLDILRRYGVRPSKGLGQSFLIDRGVLERIVEASHLTPDDIVLEVGPGTGLLTHRLAQVARAVVAVELDRKMFPILEETLRDCRNVHLVQGDILAVDPVAEITKALGMAEASTLRYKVVANLPYYITSAVLRHLLAARVRPEQLLVMVQREVARRIVASPGELSLLAISVQAFGAPEIVGHVPARAFFPRPKVDSALLRVRVYEQPKVPPEVQERFFRLVHAGFSQKRKQLHNSLAHALCIPHESVLAALAEAGIAPDRRPQTLSIEEWLRLTTLLPLDQGSQGAG
jgi:16S rRNA (adenine1518-N6/adenine1519-N6)-dimethyltransferase